MVNTDIIPTIIQQDMKHQQLVGGLRKIGLHCDGLYDLSILELVAELMGVSEGNTFDEWIDLYMLFINGANNYDVTTDGKNLEMPARLCYKHLSALLDSKD